MRTLTRSQAAPRPHTAYKVTGRGFPDAGMALEEGESSGVSSSAQSVLC